MLKLSGFNYIIQPGYSTAIIVLDQNEETAERLPSAATIMIFIVIP